jgi:tripartite-type tricarboxylate transporter receptor subunit TctC
MFSKRILLSAIAVVGGTTALALPGIAQPYPVRSITLVVPYPAGGTNDAIARIVGDHMAKTLGQPIIIENTPGAGGTTASARVAVATPDGYTILLGNMGTHAAAPGQYPNLKYDPVKDFTPIGLAAGTPVVIVTRKAFPANSLKEFVDYVRKNQDKVNEAHPGVGTQMHTFCTLLHSIMGTKTARIAYRGGAPAINDLLAGQVDFSCLSLGTVVSQIQNGTIKAIAIASAERADVIKDVPTTKEGGLPEFQVSGWNAIFGPGGLPRDIQAKLNDAVIKALDDEGTRKRLLDIGSEIPDKTNRSPHALQMLVESEVARWVPLLKVAASTAK